MDDGLRSREGNSRLEEETVEIMEMKCEGTQILEDMKDVELFIKYQAYQEAIDFLKRLPAGATRNLEREERDG